MNLIEDLADFKIVEISSKCEAAAVDVVVQVLVGSLIGVE